MISLNTKTISLIVIIILLVFGGLFIYFKNKPISQIQTNDINCFLAPATRFNLCYYDSQTGKILTLLPYSTANVTNTYYLLYQLQGNSNISYAANLSNFNLPDSYHICIRTINLASISNYKGDLNLEDYDSNSNTYFSCVSKLYTKAENHFASDSGILPCMSDQFPVVEVYLYPANFTGTTINDFERNVNTSQMILGVYGETTC